MSKIVTLSEAASIAMHAMVLVAKKEKINVLQIADLTESSKHHVAKVMQRLVKEKFITSQRGPNGGFSLRMNAKDITLLNVYEAIEGKIEIEACPLNKQVCPFDKCIYNNITNSLTQDFKNYLEAHTLESYL